MSAEAEFDILAELERDLERQIDEAITRLVDHRIAKGVIKPQDRELAIRQYRAFGERAVAEVFEKQRTDH